MNTTQADKIIKSGKRVTVHNATFNETMKDILFVSRDRWNMYTDYGGCFDRGELEIVVPDQENTGEKQMKSTLDNKILEIRKSENDQIDKAMAKYHNNYDNDLYINATKNRSIDHVNWIIDFAMWLCGHPAYHNGMFAWGKVDNLTDQEIAFLANFI